MKNEYRVRASIYVDYYLPEKNDMKTRAMLKRIKKTIKEIHKNLEVVAVSEFEEVLKGKKKIFNPLAYSFEQYIPNYTLNLNTKKEYKE